jgi:hypothetical protein
MALIFDNFPTMERAEAFVAAVKLNFGLDGWTYPDADATDTDVVEVSGMVLPRICYPFVMDPFIAAIERPKVQVGYFTASDFPDGDAGTFMKIGDPRYTCDQKKEDQIVAFVDEFGGKFIGT